MAKISRKKPKRPHRKAAPSLVDWHKMIAERSARAEPAFLASCERLRQLFAQYAVEDVLFALNVTDLWLPNISAQVKHQLAFGICVSIPLGNFASDRIRRLVGIEMGTEDVPVWEHSKRTARYTIRPMVRLSNGHLLWGAAMADRAARIWTNSISAGYLPADFPWPAVRGVVSRVKKRLEDGLEDAAFAVSARATPYAVKGIDFKYRFPKKGFPDVGDFDVLAYWPEGNRWLIGECKYNQPTFCLKDARRLRDRVFGGNSEAGQFVKIARTCPWRP